VRMQFYALEILRYAFRAICIGSSAYETGQKSRRSE
jgi:hypothetical protein